MCRTSGQLSLVVESVVFTQLSFQEAIAEIDVDRSEAVDFYEYLRISALLLKKAGKSEIFRSGLVKDAGNSMSRVCSIQ